MLPDLEAPSDPVNLTESQTNSETSETPDQSNNTSANQLAEIDSKSNVNVSTISTSVVTSVGTNSTSLTTVTQSLNINTPIMSSMAGIQPMGGMGGPGMIPPPQMIANQNAMMQQGGGTLMLQNGQLVLVPPPHMQQPGPMISSAEGHVTPSAPSDPSTSVTSVNSMNLPSVVPSTMTPVNSSSTQLTSMPAGPGMKIPGLMGAQPFMTNPALGGVPGQPHMGIPQQIINVNGQQILVPATQAPGMLSGAQPLIGQSQPGDMPGMLGANQMPPTSTNQGLVNMGNMGANPGQGLTTQPQMPNQLPNALILPNGQVSRKYFFPPIGGFPPILRGFFTPPPPPEISTNLGSKQAHI